jgi:diguanylate cyclase (GGDEF)-like protein
MARTAELASSLEPMRQIGAMPYYAPDLESRRLLSDSTVLRISNALQSSLFVKDVIHAFSSEVRRVVRRVSIRYRNRTEKLLFQEGRAQLHRCSYELNLLGKSMGEVGFMRNQPFNAEELALFEVVLCALVYPLRNALMYERALRSALKDPLTDVNNRASMEQHLDHEILSAARHRTPLALIMIDVDHFKNVNDTHGHVAGDGVLTSVANTIVRCTRDCDVVFRYGGEEFAVILTNTKAAGATLLAERIRSGVEHLVLNSDGQEIKVTVSLGVAELLPAEAKIEFLQRTDALLYRAKVAGRNRVISSES